MQKYFVIAWVISMILYSGTTVPADTSKIDLDFSLPQPADTAHQAYLGLKDGPTFFLDQINAKIIIIEIFSMYCPICQREAANVNQLFDLIESDKMFQNNIKLIGIGAGNSEFEVEFFRENYSIEFPLFSDADFVIHKKIGEKGTPFFIGLKRNPDQSIEIFYSRAGEIKDLQVFFDTLIKTSGVDFTKESK